MRVSILLALICVVAPAHAEQYRLPRVLLEIAAIEKMELYSLSPPVMDEAASELKLKHPDKPKFHEWSILGHTTVNDATEIKEIMTAVHSAIHESQGKLVNCFLPAHAVRLFLRDKSVYDVAICFHCRRVEIYKQDGKEPLDSVLIGETRLAQFDGFLQKYHLPLDSETP